MATEQRTKATTRAQGQLLTEALHNTPP